MNKEQKTMQECFGDLSIAWDELKREIMKVLYLNKIADWFSEHYFLYLILRFIVWMYILTIIFLGIWNIK